MHTVQVVELAFYGGNFTGLPAGVQEALLEHAASYTAGKPLTGIRLSTRPDHLEPVTIARLKRYGVTTVEVGAQTMVPEILDMLRRDHTPMDTVRVVKHLQQAGITAGVHLMAGLPGEHHSQAVFSAKAVAELRPDHVRIHPLVVLEGSPLAGLWRQERFSPLSLIAAVRRVAGMVHVFRQHGVPVARMGLHPPDGGWGDHLLAGPWHPAFSELVHSFIFRRLIGQGLRESRTSSTSSTTKTTTFEIHINPRDMSRAIGYKRSNARFFKRVLGSEPVFKPDETVTAGTVTVKRH